MIWKDFTPLNSFKDCLTSIVMTNYRYTGLGLTLRTMSNGHE